MFYLPSYCYKYNAIVIVLGNSFCFQWHS